MAIGSLLEDPLLKPENGGAPGSTPGPAAMLSEAKTPATVAWVRAEMAGCWVKTWLRRFGYAVALAIGFGAAINLGGVVWLRETLAAHQVLVREQVRQAVLEVLKEHHLLGAATTDTGRVLAARKDDGP